MNIISTNKKFAPGRFGIAALFATVSIGLSVLLYSGVAFMKDQSAQATPVERMPSQIDEPWAARPNVSVSEVISSDQPTLILFYPVEVCQRRYCLMPEAVEAKLGPNYPEKVNLVSVPVYAVPMESSQVKPEFPLLGWDVYVVESYANWLPAFSETVYGWGLDSPAVVLVSPSGTVLYRGDEYFSPEELEPYIEQLALSYQ